jgi:8-oxo-dGTP pyrophosphatase MutT (NUDIX family)
MGTHFGHVFDARLRHAGGMSFIPARKLSCGIVILNDEAELLLCHVTGHDHWDLPKGGPAPGESPRATALRETQEETGLALHEVPLLDLGRLDYRPRKDLHLFAALQPRFDPATLVCDSRFSDAAGRRLPEMDGFDWFRFDQVPARVTPRLATVLSERLDLPALLQRLRASEPETVA